MATPELRPIDLARLRAVFARFPSVQRVRLFGSRATGQARRASDIDLAVDAPQMSTREWNELLEAIDEAPLIYDIDIVRADSLLPGPLRESVEREGIEIHAA